MTDQISLCAGCAAGGPLAARLSEMHLPGLQVKTVHCLNLCGRPLGLALRGPGKWALLFAGVTEDDLPQIAMLAHLYAASADGLLADARPLGALRLKLVGRIPP